MRWQAQRWPHPLPPELFPEKWARLPTAYIQSDPSLVSPDLVTPRFSDMINFFRHNKLMAFDPDLVTPRFSDRKTFPSRMSLNRGPTVYHFVSFSPFWHFSTPPNSGTR